MIKLKDYKGFTLLEILLVIAAIGILAAIVLVAINPNRQISQVRDAQRRSDINAIYKALEQYLIDNKDYPEGITGTPKAICNNTVTTNCVNLSILVPTYIAAIPKDPNGGVYEVYINPANNRIGVEAPGVELGQSISVNLISTTTPTPEELIQAEIAAGTLVPTGTQQLKYERLVYTNNAGTQTYIDKATTTRTCPTGYIAVPGNSMYGTSEFCVMKYEARTGSSTVAATTQAAGTPAMQISQTIAITACNLNNTGGTTGYSLISNAEWMTIARNIEAVSSNWIGGNVGSGALFKGNSQYPDYIGAPWATSATTDDSDGYFSTNNSLEEKRTFTLSNGQVVWDLSGNMWEWTTDTIMPAQKPIDAAIFNSYQYWIGTEWTAITDFGILSYDLTRPSNNTWNSNQNMGLYNGRPSDGGPHGFSRGGSSGRYGERGTGIFTMSFAPLDGNFLTNSFRCVLR